MISLTTLPEKNWQGSFYLALLTQGFLLVVVLNTSATTQA
jgi:hypothetical protein